MKSKILREIALICVPLVLLIGAGAWISREQSERNAERQIRESGPLRVRIWGIHNMGAWADEKAAGYDYGYRIDAHLEGMNVTLKPDELWVLRVKSAQVGVPNHLDSAGVINISAPLIFAPGDKLPATEVLAMDAGSLKPREIGLWLYCDSSPANSMLKLEIEAVAGRLTSPMGKWGRKKFIASGPRLAVPSEEIPLRVWNADDAKSNIIKSQY